MLAPPGSTAQPLVDLGTPVCAGLPVTYTLSAKSGKLEVTRAVKVELAR